MSLNPRLIAGERQASHTFKISKQQDQRRGEVEEVMPETGSMEDHGQAIQIQVLDAEEMYAGIDQLPEMPRIRHEGETSHSLDLLGMQD